MAKRVPQALAVVGGGLRVHAAEAAATQSGFHEQADVLGVTLGVTGVPDERSGLQDERTEQGGASDVPYAGANLGLSGRFRGRCLTD